MCAACYRGDSLAPVALQPQSRCQGFHMDPHFFGFRSGVLGNCGQYQEHLVNNGAVVLLGTSAFQVRRWRASPPGAPGAGKAQGLCSPYGRLPFQHLRCALRLLCSYLVVLGCSSFTE